MMESPTDDEIRKFAELNLDDRSCTWQTLAAALDIHASPAVDTDDADDSEKAVEMLLAWRRERGDDANMKELHDALRNVALQETCSAPSTRRDAGSLIGRDVELQQLFTYFYPSPDSREFRVVVLHGAGGVGKTFLAEYFAQTYDSFYGDGIEWISAESSLSIHQSNCAVVRKNGFQTFGRYVEDLRSVQAMASSRKAVLLVYDNVDELELVESCIPPATSTVHVLVITQSQSFQGPWVDVPKVQLKPLGEDQAVRLVMREMAVERDLLSSEDDEALNELIGQTVTGGLPLALDYAARKFKMNPSVTLAVYLDMFKKHVEEVRQQVSTVTGWLQFYHLSGLEEELKSKFDVQSVSDIRSLSDGQIQRLGLSFFSQRRLKEGIMRLKSDKPIKLPLWEMDIQGLSSTASHAHKLLYYCALLSFAPVPERLLRECLMEHIIPLSDQQFQETLAKLMDSTLISQKDGVSSAGHKCYTLPSRIQQFIRHYHLTDLDVQYGLTILSQVMIRHLPPAKDVRTAVWSMDPYMSEILPHVQALAKTIDRSNVLDPVCEEIIDFVRVLAVTVRDPWLDLSLCQQGVKRALSKRLESKDVASRLVDLALCYAERKQYEACQQTLHEAQVIINRLQNPPISLTARVMPLQSMMFSNQLMFYVQFGGDEFSDLFLSEQGYMKRFIDLQTQFSLQSDNAHIEEIFSIIMPSLSQAVNPYSDMLPQLMQRLDLLGAKSAEQVYQGVLQDMGAEKLLEMAQDTDSILRLNALSNRKAWKVLLNYDAPRDVNLQTLNYWQSCGEYLCSVGKAMKASVVYGRILEMLQKCLPPGHPSIGETLKWMGDCYLLMDDLSQAFRCYFEASGILSLANQDPLQLAKFFTNLAKSCSTFKPELAEEKLMHALQLYERIGDPLLVYAITKDLASFFYSRKHYERALEVCQNAEMKLIKQFGQLNMQMPGRMICLAVNAVKVSSLGIHCLKEMGEYESAVVNSELLFNETNQAAVQAKMVASGRAVLADVKLCVGDCLFAGDLTAEALSSYREALQLYESSVGKGNPKLIAGLLALAQFYQLGENSADSVDQSFLNSVDALKKARKDKDLAQHHAEDLSNLVSFFASVGDEAAAQMALEASMAISELVEQRVTSVAADEDLLLPWDVPEQLLSQTGSGLGHKITGMGTVSSCHASELPFSMSYSIKLPPLDRVRDLLTWSCTPSMLTTPEEGSVETEGDSRAPTEQDNP